MTDVEKVREYLGRLDAFLEARRFDELLTGNKRSHIETCASMDLITCQCLVDDIDDLSELSALDQLEFQTTLADLQRCYPPESLEASFDEVAS